LDDLISNALMPPGRLGSVYIAHGVQREPLDQTDLKDDVDAILGGGGGSFSKLTGRRAPVRPGDTMVGPHLIASQGLPRGATSWSPLESSRVVLITIKFISF
jgi:hypothetical protein